MSDLIRLVMIALVGLGVIVLGWWLLIESEGVYLGRRVVVWLYDVFADRYDDIKHFRQEYDHQFLAQPIMHAIAPHKSPLVLDVATGTARLPLALLRHAHFQGRVVGVDLSRKMLRQAARKLGAEPRVSLIWTPAENLPFPDDCFDVVTCLEALEFMASSEKVLAEIVRVLRPGGILLVTNRIHTKLMPGKTMTSERIADMLDALGVEDIQVSSWQVDYDRVWGTKADDSQPTGGRPLAEVLLCPRCHEALMEEEADGWRCPECNLRAPIGADGVVELP